MTDVPPTIDGEDLNVSKADILKEIVKAIVYRLGSKPVAFSQPLVAATQMQFESVSDGKLRMLSNPTGNVVTVTLAQGTNPSAPEILNIAMAPNSVQPLWIPFAGGLYCSAGAGCIISGEYTP